MVGADDGSGLTATPPSPAAAGLPAVWTPEWLAALVAELNGREAQDAAQRMVELLQRIVGCEGLAVRYRDGGRWPFLAASGLSHEFLQAATTFGRSADAGSAPADPLGPATPACWCGRGLSQECGPGVARTAHGSVWTADLPALPAAAAAALPGCTFACCRAAGYRSVAAVPVRTGAGAVVGLLQLHDRRPDRCAADVLRALEAATPALGVVWQLLWQEKARVGAEARFRTVVEQIPAITYIVRFGAAPVFLYVSPQIQALTGYAPQDCLRDPEFWHHQIHPADRETTISQFHYACQARQAFRAEYRILARDGRSVWFQDHAQVVRDADDRPLCLQGVVTDVSERKRGEERDALVDVELRQRQKLESLGTLASGVAHEINNPVNGILNFAQLILDDAAPDSTPHRHAGAIIAEAQRVTTIVRNLLQFARQDRQASSLARLCDIVNAALTLVHALLRRERIALTVVVPEDLPPLRCRSQQLQQVLINLLTNARDALNERYPGAHPDKIIAVTASVREAAGRPWVRLTVTDHGVGIPVTQRARLFEPFFTTKPKTKGTGLGLAICHGIVKDHGGEILVESEVGEYTRFHVELPATAAAAAAGAAATRPGAE